MTSERDREEDRLSGLTDEIVALRVELARLNSHRFIRIQNSAWRLIGMQFARGLAFGLGSVVGASLLVSVVVFLLSEIDFIPIIGDWAAQIAREVQQLEP
ncbi:DUF5665 domain-containing protein [Rhodovulum sp. YNF3179]|uniref:DUF5665 domain-containing protein n=1 Tax=Rhodovulum sp. YNF3179 TaxID=3425127 RepID=UPI003D330172